MTAKVTAYYFSAHWCPPCRGFTPNLAKFYKKVNSLKELNEDSFKQLEEQDKKENIEIKEKQMKDAEDFKKEVDENKGKCPGGHDLSFITELFNG